MTAKQQLTNNAARQRQFKERQRASGKKQLTAFIDESVYQTLVEFAAQNEITVAAAIEKFVTSNEGLQSNNVTSNDDDSLNATDIAAPDAPPALELDADTSREIESVDELDASLQKQCAQMSQDGISANEIVLFVESALGAKMTRRFKDNFKRTNLKTFVKKYRCSNG